MRAIRATSGSSSSDRRAGAFPFAARPDTTRLQTSAGVHILAYWSQPNAHEMAPGPFESYLEEEGLQGALQERARRGEDDVPGREHFVRCAKSLLLVADGGSPRGHDEVLGLPLEIVPVTNPFTARRGTFEIPPAAGDEAQP
jgi:hypothetical protein